MLMFACAMLLFHAVVPHHHHDGVPVCFEQHNHNHDSHNNHGSCDDDACVISEFFSPSDIQHIDVQFDEYQFLNIYFCDCLESGNLIFGLEGTQFRERPYLFIINETDVTRLGVLRGPPFHAEV